MHYGREYHRLIEVEWKEETIPAGSWLLEVVEWYFTTRSGSRSTVGHVQAVREVIKLLEKDARLAELVKPSVEKFDTNQLPYFFGLIESALRQSSLSDAGKSNVSRDLRQICCNGLENLLSDNSLDRRIVKFKSSLIRPVPPSPLLSDSVVSIDGTVEEPIGALSHDDFQELYLKTKKKISNDLQRVIDACYKDLDFFSEMRDKLKILRAKRAPENLLHWVRRQILLKSINDHHLKFRDRYSDEEIISAYLEVYDENGGAKLEFDESQFFSKLDDILIRVVGDFKPYFARAIGVFTVPYRCASAELQSLFILLLCITGWNSGSLIGMERDNVELQSQCFKLQGFKEKTDDYTPAVYVDKAKYADFNAVKTLLWHREALIEQELISAEEQLFWFSGPRKSSFERVAIGIIPKDKFFSRHSIPAFEYRFIRNQVFERDRLEGRNVESIRRKAGHRSRNTTVGYLDSLVSRKMFSSMNLEFSRRLESTVIFRLVESGRVDAPFDAGRVRLALFSEVDELSYCSNRENPPPQAEVFDGVCAALDCHRDGGCENRKILIDNRSIRDLVRQKHYYINNWRRLESNNAAAFNRFHFDRMAYVLSLYDYIKNSQYSVFLTQAEEDVENERTVT